jgi:hypothetical protein
MARHDSKKPNSTRTFPDDGTGTCIEIDDPDFMDAIELLLDTHRESTVRTGSVKDRVPDWVAPTTCRASCAA